MLIVDRRLPFADLAARLYAEGWQRAADPTAPSPLIEDEPEFVEFQRLGARLYYQFDPATGMRQLRVAGPDGDEALAALAALAACLPCEGVERARELLRAPDVASRLLGLGMVEALGARESLDEVAAMISDASATVARQALHTCVRLIAEQGGAALRTLGQWKLENPDQSLIFLLAGSTYNKLQILRWLGHDRRASNADIDAVLRTALADPDWEVRLTALVVAARLRANQLLDQVATTALPQESADGVNTDERRMLRTIQLYAIELLQGAAVPAPSEAPPNTRALMHDHLLRCLAGDPVAHHEKAFLFLTSLLTPLPDEVPSPIVVPPGIRATEDGFLLEAHGIALCWVPPLAHWLGEELPRMQVANPIRNVVSSGFFIAREAGTALMDFDAAVAYCERLGAATGLKIRLPTSDEWEMAARGPDGRRFPWGNNARAEARFAASPWGVTGAVGLAAQWTSSMRDAAMLVRGGEKQWVCAMREPARRDVLCAVRLVVAP
ncbi:formylglycine-generating enzyme family protein [Massilia mucilaginosa]|uniref:formylglycine-generating enzyme family protein n=1 Tax=Massilia mucilaginosa TaxID=2609282 RepID=UPI001CB6DBC2